MIYFENSTSWRILKIQEIQQKKVNFFFQFLTFVKAQVESFKNRFLMKRNIFLNGTLSKSEVMHTFHQTPSILRQFQIFQFLLDIDYKLKNLHLCNKKISSLCSKMQQSETNISSRYIVHYL